MNQKKSSRTRNKYIALAINMANASLPLLLINIAIAALAFPFLLIPISTVNVLYLLTPFFSSLCIQLFCWFFSSDMKPQFFDKSQQTELILANKELGNQLEKATKLMADIKPLIFDESENTGLLLNNTEINNNAKKLEKPIAETPAPIKTPPVSSSSNHITTPTL